LQARGLLDTSPTHPTAQADYDNDDIAQDEADSLAAWGLVAEPSADDCTQPPEPKQERMAYLWPCNAPTWTKWNSLHTQWRSGMGGREGLDYGAVCALMRDVWQVPRQERPQLMLELQHMEQAALHVWAQAAQLRDAPK
jgi:hypothetical protein